MSSPTALSEQAGRLADLEAAIASGDSLRRADALWIASLEGQILFDLFGLASRIRSVFRGDAIDICAIVNAKSGGCPEDCVYCAQSIHSKSDPPRHPLIPAEVVHEKASEAFEGGARRFCIVTSGRKVSTDELSRIVHLLSVVGGCGLLPCATLGLLRGQELVMLKAAGLVRYHHNIETSERLFPRICTTHSYADKMKTIADAKEAGLSLCSGGIFGLGETWEDRIDMAMALRSIDPDSVPLNFLSPIAGTKLEAQPLLRPLEALKITALFRLMLPKKEIRVCGGRMQVLGELNSLVFLAGADGLLSGNYLTTTGRNYSDDKRLISSLGLRIAEPHDSLTAAIRKA